MTVLRYRLRAPRSLANIADYRRAAERAVPTMVWDYVDKGAEDLVTLRANRDAFSRWSLRMRVLRACTDPEIASAVGGTPIGLPVLLAPTGMLGLSHWTGDVGAALAAEESGTRLILSTASTWSIEEVAEATREDHFFQLYAGRKEVTRALLRRARDAGYRALFVTVDTSALPNREYERKAGMELPLTVTPRRALDLYRHPRWLGNAIRHRRASLRNFASGGSLKATVESVDLLDRQVASAMTTWDDIAWIREEWRDPIYLKGVTEVEDACKAVEIGCEGIVVSNHGGRQLDCARPSLDALPEIAKAVRGRAEVLLDGGIRRGTDIVKALCLGASAVIIGRPYIYGMMVDGQRGAHGVLEILRAELCRTLTLMGVPSVKQLDDTWLAPNGHAVVSQLCGGAGETPEAGVLSGSSG